MSVLLLLLQLLLLRMMDVDRSLPQQQRPNAALFILIVRPVGWHPFRLLLFLLVPLWRSAPAASYLLRHQRRQLSKAIITLKPATMYYNNYCKTMMMMTTTTAITACRMRRS